LSVAEAGNETRATGTPGRLPINCTKPWASGPAYSDKLDIPVGDTQMKKITHIPTASSLKILPLVSAREAIIVSLIQRVVFRRPLVNLRDINQTD
jgi:hypothetical protein